jgi:hypothetical protein
VLAVRRVGLSVFPPATSAGNRCATPQNANYNSKSSAYTIVALSKDYRLSNGQLDSGSDLVKTLNCVQGNGTTAYADAIERRRRSSTRTAAPRFRTSSSSSPTALPTPARRTTRARPRTA